MDIKVLGSEDIQFTERDVQKAFEHDLSKLEDGLEYVASEVHVGTGRIDTLAYDSNEGQAVFVEFKGPGEFTKDALIQLMDYLSWFTRDENRLAVLKNFIRQHKPAITELEPTIRLICVVASMDDERVRNAIYVISNPVKIISYVVAKDTAGNVVVMPKVEADNGDVEARMPVPKSEEDLFRAHPHLVDVFSRIRDRLKADGVEEYPAGNGFNYRRDRRFAVVRFKQKFIYCELKVGQGRVKDPLFKYYRQGASNTGYVRLYPKQPLPEKLFEWIDLAKVFQSTNEEEDEGSDAEAQL